MMWIFTNKRLWKWMSGPLTGWLNLKPGPLAGLTPAVLASFPKPAQPVNRRKIRQMGRYVPHWLWRQMQFCSKWYHDFFVRFWPELAGLAWNLLYMEWLLYVEPGYMKYREHLAHMFKVAFVAHSLLDCDAFADEVANHQFDESPHFKNWASRNAVDLDFLECAAERRLVVRWAALLASLLHDFGYAYKMRTGLDRQLHRVYGWVPSLCDGLEPTAACQQAFESSLAMEFIREKVACDNSRLVPDSPAAQRRRTGFVRDSAPLNHGIASSLFMIQLREDLLRARALNNRLRVALELAAEAAMIHDMSKLDQWTGLRTSGTGDPGDAKRRHFLLPTSHVDVPVAVLLMFCDELAIWRRPRIEEPPRSRLSGQVTYKFRPEKTVKAVRVELTPSDLKIELKYSDPTDQYAQKLH
ncbi:hypothetical protein LCGC14_1838170, partial [marine sediment metagenome]